MKIMRPSTDMEKLRKYKISRNASSMLTININEEYAMKDEEARKKQRTISKEVFSWTMVSPTMKHFYKFNDLVALSNVKFSKNDLNLINRKVQL